METAADRTLTRQDTLVEEALQRGAAIYESELRVALEQDAMGQLVAIHPESGDYVVAEREEDAMSGLRARCPEGVLFVRRIGPPTPGDLRLAARLDPRSRVK